MIQVILGFHCVGKTTFVRKLTEAGGKAVSLSESEFHIADVLNRIHDGETIVVLPATREIAQTLVNYRIEFHLVYPERSEKNIYLSRLVKSGRRMLEVHDILKDWDETLNKLESWNGCIHTKLGSEEYLSDKLWEH